MSNVTHMSDFSQASGFALDEFIEFQEAKKTTPMWFPLTASSIGKKKIWRVLAWRINVLDRASVDLLPQHLQKGVWDRLNQMRSEQEKMEEEGREPQDILENLAHNEKYVKTGEALMHAAFVDPQLVMHQRDEDVAARKLWVGRIVAEDKIAFLMACQDADSVYAKQFELFRPESAIDVPDRDHGEVASVSAIRPAGDAGSGDSEHHPL